MRARSANGEAQSSGVPFQWLHAIDDDLLKAVGPEG
jgi:hypothetical protein